MSSRQMIDSGAELVCSVANTMWPVSEASMPVPVVSLSRIWSRISFSAIGFLFWGST
jgi:hypothetical protein